jgi:hypothetical protein
MNVIANLAVARDGFAFNPGPNDETKFPADYQVDYIRVWKLTDDNEYKTSKFLGAKSTIPPIKYQTPSPAEQNDTELKKKVRFIYDKKKLSNEIGFLSMTPVQALKDQAGAYLIQLNGLSMEDVLIQMIDSNNNQFSPILGTNNSYYLIFPKKGSYQITIESGENKSKFTLTI